MQIKKMIQIVDYVLAKYDGRLNYTKLIKILYLADRQAMQESGYPITGDSYVSMANGVVLSGLYDLIKDNFRNANVQTLWDGRFVTDGMDLVKIGPVMPTGLLSDFEMETLDSVDARFHNKPFGKLIDYIHDPMNCPEWQNTNSSIPLPNSRIYESLGFSKEQMKALEEEEKSYADEDRLFDSLSKPAECHG